jgi:hypothetical protein
MDAGLGANRAVLRQNVDHRPVRCERHGQDPHHVEKLLEPQNRCEPLRYRRKKRQGVSLLDESAFPILFGALPFGDFNTQALVRLLECNRALFHAAFEFIMRTP